MSSNQPDDADANTSTSTSTSETISLLDQMEAEGLDEFYVTLDPSADVGPDEFKVALIDPKAKR